MNAKYGDQFNCDEEEGLALIKESSLLQIAA